MKTKILTLCLFGVLIFTGCMKSQQDARAEIEARIGAVEAMVDYDVPVKQGMATIVKLGDDTLAVTSVAARISVPNYAVAQNELKVTYSDDEIYENYSSFQYWQYVAFEDSRAADYDYNDLVIHCRVKGVNAGFQNGKVVVNHIIGVQPVALGGTRPLKLGILYKETADADHLSEKILCQDVRAELFNGNVSFPINTDPNKEIKQVTDKVKSLFEVKNYEANFKVVWFIENGTDRFYAATTNFDANNSFEMLTKEGLPYGISMTKKWDYPVEKVSMREAYPGFDEWLRNGNQDVLLANPDKSKIFPASINKLWDWDQIN